MRGARQALVAAASALAVTTAAAAPAVRTATAEPAEEPGVALRAAVALRTAGDLPAARRALEALATATPEDPTVWIELAVTCAWDHRLAQALAHYQRAAALAPTSAAARNGAARIHGWLGDEAQARAGFEASLAIAPGDVEAILGLASLARARLDTGAARALYRRALALAPAQPEAEAGLAALDALRRIELRLAVERDLTDAGPLRGEAAVTVERDRGWRYRLGLSTVDRGQPLVDDAGDGWFGAAGVQRRGRALSVAVGAELGRDAGVGFVGATSEVGYRFGAVAVSAAGRLRRTADAWRDLSSLGVEAPVVVGVTVGARGFVAVADGTEAAVGQLGWHRGALATRLELTVAPGGASLDGAGAMVGVDPGGRWAVVARGRWRAEPSVATVGLELVTRF